MSATDACSSFLSSCAATLKSAGSDMSSFAKSAWAHDPAFCINAGLAMTALTGISAWAWNNRRKAKAAEDAAVAEKTASLMKEPSRVAAMENMSEADKTRLLEEVNKHVREYYRASSSAVPSSMAFEVGADGAVGSYLDHKLGLVDADEFAAAAGTTAKTLYHMSSLGGSKSAMSVVPMTPFAVSR